MNSGIGLIESCSNIVENNNIILNPNQGIFLGKQSNYNIILNNTSNLNKLGLQIDNSNSNILNNNTFLSNSVVGIQLNSDISITAYNNRLTESSIHFTGDKLEHYNTHSIDTSNTYSDKPIYYWNNRTSGIVPQDAGEIILANCKYVQIRDLTIENSWYPIQLFYSSFNNISNNVVINNTINGISLWYSDQNNIKNNTCNNNKYSGFSIKNSKNNLITNNKAIGNTLEGLLFNLSTGNIIANNDIISNHETGFMIRNSNNNKIYHNNIINNPVQAIEKDTNKNDWDNGNGEGNYWSDYKGLDNGVNGRMANDGIGDTELPHLGLDHYPFINHSGWSYPGLPLLFDPGDVNSNGSYMINWYPIRGAISYLLEEASNSEFSSPIEIYNGTGTVHHVKNRSNGTYHYRLKARGEKSISPWSNKVDITVDWPPGKPQDLMVSVFPEGNVLNISWDNTVSDIRNYELYYKSQDMTKWELLTSLYHSENRYDHTDLIDGCKYEYKVQAFDERGQNSDFSDIIYGIPEDSVAPSQPKEISIKDITNDSIKLTWKPNPERDIAGYYIYQFTTAEPGGWGDLRSIADAGSEEFTDKDLNELTTYYYVVVAFDEVPNNSTYSQVVFATTIIGQHGPEINNSIQNFSMNEDCVDILSINLYNWFKDINNDPLTFSCNGNKNINVNISQEDGSVELRPNKNWFGNESLVFFASDGLSEIYDSITITVLPVNDHPEIPYIFEPTHRTIIRWGSFLNFIGECKDPDLPNDELTFRWISDIQGDLGSGDKLGNVQLLPGTHNITLSVFDSSDNTSSNNITVIVLEGEPLESKGEDKTSLMGLILGLIIVVILMVLLFVFLLKKRSVKAKSSIISTPTSSRFSLLSLRVSDSTIKDKVKTQPPINDPQENQQSTLSITQKLKPP
jgi:parallel beta-helix repeat protein